MVCCGLRVDGIRAGALHQVSCSLAEHPGRGGHGPPCSPELHLAGVSGDSSSRAQGLLLCETQAARRSELGAKL